jgi:hypothetical protein
MFLLNIIEAYDYEACPESKDTEVLNMYNNLNLQKWHCEWFASI